MEREMTVRIKERGPVVTYVLHLASDPNQKVGGGEASKKFFQIARAIGKEHIFELNRNMTGGKETENIHADDKPARRVALISGLTGS